MKVTPRSRRARDIAYRGYERPAPADEDYLRSVTVQHTRAGALAARVAGPAGDELGGAGDVERRREAAAVGARGHDLLAPVGRADLAGGDDDRLAALGALERALDGDPPHVAFLTFLVLVVSESVEALPASPPVPVVKRLRTTSLPAAGVEVSAYERVPDGLMTPSVPGKRPLAIRCGRQCLPLSVVRRTYATPSSAG